MIVKQCSLTIYFSNGSSLPIVYSPDFNDGTNVCTHINIKESAMSTGKNPVGVVSSNYLSLTLKSRDGSLFPENSSSPYYGLMNASARIGISITDDVGVVSFGTFFVESWVPQLTSSTPYTVKIVALDKLSLFGRNPVPIAGKMLPISSDSYFRSVITAVNSKLSSPYRILVPDGTLFNKFPNLSVSDFGTDKMNEWLNIFAQSTLTNIYLTRNSTILTDYVLDSPNETPSFTLSDTTNVTSVSLNSSSITAYTGVQVSGVSYSVTKDSEQLLSLSDLTLNQGINTISGLMFETSGVYKITNIVIESSLSSTSDIILTNLTYNSSGLSLSINNSSSSATQVNLKVFGLLTSKSKILYSSGDTSVMGSVFECTNSILPQSYLNSYSSDLLSVINTKSETLTLSGLFDLRMTVGSLVNVFLTGSLKLSGVYKIVSLDWSVASTIKCTAVLQKVVKE